MTTILIQGGDARIATGLTRADVLIADGVVTDIAPQISVPSGATVLDASGSVVTPGFVDLHAHLRQPGRQGAETIETGTRAGSVGGYTCIVAMPNTEPTIDNVEVVRAVQSWGATATTALEVSAAITKGRAGEELVDFAALCDAGVRIFTDDGSGVQDGALMRRACEIAAGIDIVLAQHCEDSALSAGAVMNEGKVSSRLGLVGMPAEAEEAMVLRDLALARITGARLHFLHLSVAGSVARVRTAKRAGQLVTAEATPHHFSLTDEMLDTYDANFKVNPPLRTAPDVQAVRNGLYDGAIDCIATDHAPHTPESKDATLAGAPAGMLGLETAFALAVTHLVNGELAISLEDVIRMMSTTPAHIAGVSDRHGTLAVGRPANVAVVDPEELWTVDRTQMASKSRNTPFDGMKLKGRVRHTIYEGEPVVITGQAQR